MILIAATLAATVSLTEIAFSDDVRSELVGPVRDRHDDELFTLAISKLGALHRRGEPGVARIRLEAKGEYKCNVDYPYKFEARDREGVTYEPRVTRREALTIHDDLCTMDIAFTPEIAGMTTLEGTFSFSVCTQQRCVLERLELGLTIAVESK